MAKNTPEIKPLTVELTAQEVLALRYIHSNWAHSNGNAPFCDAMSETFLEKLGGYLDLDEALWHHPIAKEWYDACEQCADCGRRFPEDKMIKGRYPNFDEDNDCYLCQECNNEQR